MTEDRSADRPGAPDDAAGVGADGDGDPPPARGVMRPGVLGAIGAGAGIVATLVAVAVLVWSEARDDPPDRGVGATVLDAVLAEARPGGDPFDDLDEVAVALGDECLLVAVASSLAERARGLRGFDDLGPYDGMLFVYEADTEGAFTMVGVERPLDIGFYEARGGSVDRRRMEPCPDGNVEDCPAYRSQAPYRFALETEAGDLGPGDLAPCG